MKGLVAPAAALALAVAGQAEAGSARPVLGMTGAPVGGGAEPTCQSCHTGFPLNPDKAGRIVLKGVPAVYVPGRAYPLVLQVSHPNARRWGFQATAITRRTFNGAGDFAPAAGDRTTQRSAGGDGRAYIQHGGPGRLATGIGTPNTFVWKFNWIAPATNVGDVLFYAAANMANADNSVVGDKIYSGGGPLAVSKGEGRTR